jgi:hypothetical protein
MTLRYGNCPHTPGDSLYLSVQYPKSMSAATLFKAGSNSTVRTVTKTLYLLLQMKQKCLLCFTSIVRVLPTALQTVFNMQQNGYIVNFV